MDLLEFLTVYTSIDVLRNKFEGHIPRIMGDLMAIHALNLSHSELQGHIPSSLEDLTSI